MKQLNKRAKFETQDLIQIFPVLSFRITLKSLQHLEHDLSSLYVIRKKYKNLMVQQ
jgi:hypothetical protein